MKLPLAYYGDPVLRQKAKTITTIDDDIRQLVADMEQTMEENNGCGLAAPQVHRSLALFITRIPRQTEDESIIPGELCVFINPKILNYSQEEWACSEGCLSIPGLRGEVSRPFKVILQAMNLEGEIFTEEFEEFDAHVVMHENDHLNGVLYIDRLSQKQKRDIAGPLKALKQKLADKR